MPYNPRDLLSRLRVREVILPDDADAYPCQGCVFCANTGYETICLAHPELDCTPEVPVTDPDGQPSMGYLNIFFLPEALNG